MDDKDVKQKNTSKCNQNVVLQSKMVIYTKEGKTIIVLK